LLGWPSAGWAVSAGVPEFQISFWQRPWVISIALVMTMLVARVLLRYRTRHIQRTNHMLLAQVSARTRSIEEARRKLEESHKQLSREVEERRKADQARNEVEARFKKAFQNAPIGMGLLDRDGKVFDANPALSSMLWPTQKAPGEPVFAQAVSAGDRERFTSRYARLVSGAIDTIEERFECESASGDTLQTEVNLSTVFGDDGSFLYSVMQIQDLTDAVKLTDKLEQQARYDELTGLHNRRAFESELETAWQASKERDEHGFLLYMDLDQFKVVNDTSGHAAGDKLLQQLAEILKKNVRGDDTVARMGGDEFAIILWGSPKDGAERIAETIRAAIEDYRFHWEAETYKVGISIGGVPLDARIGDVNELQQLADSACFAAKEAGRNCVHIVDGDKDGARAHRRQVRWVQRLREAMDNNRFAIYAQAIKPLIDRGDEPPHYEVLLRLRDPESRKLVPPGAFLPAVDRYGLSLELDQWVVRNLIKALFLHQSFAAEHRRYWINLSGSSLGEPRFAAFLRKTIEDSPLPPGTINFEVTESSVMRNVAEAGQLISELREMGCEFTLDDFGSGFSSFGYLRHLPVTGLKIDGMFIRNILSDEADRIFVKSIIDIARTLGINTICECIEDDERHALVRELGADYAQGFALERPFELAPHFPGLAAPPASAIQQRKKAG